MVAIDSLSTDAASQTGRAYKTLMSSLHSLSSGSMINSAADDPAGLAIRELLRSDIATANQATRNVNDGVSMLQTAEGAASVISDNLVRMKQLAAQASNGTYSDSQKNIMAKEFENLAAENARIISDTKFNGVSILEGGQSIDIATGDGQTITYDSQALSIGAAALTNDPQAAQAAVNAAIRQVSSSRGNMGSKIAELQRAAEVIAIRSENLLAAESRISDADMAKQVASMMGNKVQTELAIGSQVHAGAVSQAINLLLG